MPVDNAVYRLPWWVLWNTDSNITTMTRKSVLRAKRSDVFDAMLFSLTVFEKQLAREVKHVATVIHTSHCRYNRGLHTCKNCGLLGGWAYGSVLRKHKTTTAPSILVVIIVYSRLNSRRCIRTRLVCVPRLKFRPFGRRFHRPFIDLFNKTARNKHTCMTLQYKICKWWQQWTKTGKAVRVHCAYM